MLPRDFRDPFGALADELSRSFIDGSSRLWMLPEFAQALIDERNGLLSTVERLTEQLAKGAQAT